MALMRKRAASDLQMMPPPPPAKRIKRPKEVLDEEVYTDALSQIIARDFFPGLLESETQQEYLDALNSRDDAWISSAGRRLQQVMTPRGQRSAGAATPLRRPDQGVAIGRTPTAFVGETPVSVASTQAAQAKKVDTTVGLAAFQAKYTSEDNESFYKLLDKQNQKRAEKYAWLWNGNKMPSKRALKQMEVEAKLLQERGSLVDDGFRKDRLAIKDKDDRLAAPKDWNHDAKNAFMFRPDGVEDSGLETLAERAQAESRAAPKLIIYENTRVPQPLGLLSDATSIPSSPSLSAVRDAIAGKRRPSDHETSVAGNETPRVNGYAFVDDEDDEPEPATASAPVIDLGPGDATPNPFKLQEQSKREGVHHRMVDRIALSKRTSAVQGFTGKADRTPVPKFPSSPRVSGPLTPAAQRLWTQVGNSGKSGGSTPFNGVRRTPMTTTKGSGLKQLLKRA
jgi:protein DGCR14